MLYLLFACSSGAGGVDASVATMPTLVEPPWGPPSVDTPERLGETSEQQEGPIFDETFDVLVVGSGPAGAAAAITAEAAGVSVLLVERDDRAGVGVTLASRAFAVGTPQQAYNGITDTPELAAAEWSDITGASGDLPGVVDLLEHSAETLDWIEAHGALINASVGDDVDGGTIPRIHDILWPGSEGGDALLAYYTGELRTGVEVTGPVVWDGRVVGATWRDLETGEEGTTGAGAVVLATGGFLRNTSLVATYAPDLAAREYVFETNPTSDGGGVPFLDAVGAASQSPESIGVYVHAIQDPAAAGGEALVAMGADEGLYVDADGQRFADESLTRSFDLYGMLPEGDVYAVLTTEQALTLTFMRPYYNWADSAVPEFLTFEAVEAIGGADVWSGATLAEAAELAGIDAEGLATTVESWNETVEAGREDAFGRDLTPATVLEDTGWVVLHLLPGVAKNFGGVATDASARVLDASGAPIPGLYAAGELVGMVVGGGGGDGFAGSVTACYRGGIIAGTAAAAR